MTSRRVAGAEQHHVFVIRRRAARREQHADLPEAPPSPLVKMEGSTGERALHTAPRSPVTLSNLRLQQKTHSSSCPPHSSDSLTRSPKKPRLAPPALKTSAADKKSMRPGHRGSGIGLQVGPGGARDGPPAPGPPARCTELSAAVSRAAAETERSEDVQRDRREPEDRYREFDLNDADTLKKTHLHSNHISYQYEEEPAPPPAAQGVQLLQEDTSIPGVITKVCFSRAWRRHQETPGDDQETTETAGDTRRHQRHQETTGDTRRHQETPGDTRRQQETPGDTRRQQETPGDTRRQQETRRPRRPTGDQETRGEQETGRHQETPGDTRRRQETPGDTRGQQETPGDTRQQETPGVLLTLQALV
ncbi:unnamed protein product [Pleuronectes platessa]|uniref:Uncharacterized protein n=1 Tax=Pleuronectes platessa TaxID=8262 RepID=A0A9N7YF12_PLEPL|nr:unnamed protein product [Pleuronectes platessa]